MDLWTEASRDHQAEASMRRHAQVMVRIAHLWPFLAAAEDIEAFRLRRTLADAQIDQAVADVVGFGEDFAPLRSEVDTTLEGDWTTMAQARRIERQTAALKTAYSAPDGTKATCGTCGKEIQSQDYAWYHMARDFPHGEDHYAHPAPHKASKTAGTWHPDTDTAGNKKFGDDPNQPGTYVDDQGIIHNGLTLAEAKAQDPNVTVADADIPLTTDAAKTAGHEVEVGSVPNCDICQYEEGQTTPAEYDARLTNHPQARGSWANVCERHFQQYGPGQTGTGFAQRLRQRAAKTAGFPGDNPQERDYDDSAPAGGVQVTDMDSRVAYANYTMACMDAGVPPLPQQQWEAQGSPAGPEASQQAQAPTPVDQAQQQVQGAAKTADFFDDGGLDGTVDPAPDVDATGLTRVEDSGDEWSLLSNTVAAALNDFPEPPPFGEGASAPHTGAKTAATCGHECERCQGHDEYAHDAGAGGMTVFDALHLADPDPDGRGAYYHHRWIPMENRDGSTTMMDGFQRGATIIREAAAWGRRHYEDLASFISSQDDREPLAKHFAQALSGTNPAFRPEQFVAAASQPGYQVRGGTGTANYSRQHFQTLADAIKTYPGEKGQMAQALADHLGATNPRFNRDLFLRAAQGALSTEADTGIYCPTCKGSGAHPWDPRMKCPKCKGSGLKRQVKRQVEREVGKDFLPEASLHTAGMVRDEEHAQLEAEWQRAFRALQEAGLEADADHPIAAAYRAASNAVNHANRSRDFNIATGQPTAAKVALAPGDTDEFGDEQVTCPECRGSGVCPRCSTPEPCGICHGDKVVPKWLADEAGNRYASAHTASFDHAHQGAKRVAYYNLVNDSGDVVAGPYVDVEDANAALTGRQDDDLHVEPAEEPDDSEGEFASYGSLSTEAEYHYIRERNGKYEIWQKGTGKTLSVHDSKEQAEAAFRAMMQSKHGRIACRKCVAGKDPSGGGCDYCDGVGSLDLTLAMVKAADGWDQGITREAFVTTREAASGDCGNCGHPRSSHSDSEGASPCYDCRTSGSRCPGYVPQSYGKQSSVEAAWADTKADLVRHHGKDVALTYNDDLGVNSVSGKLAYNGDTVQVGSHPPIKSAYVLDVQPLGTGDDREWGQGPGKEPSFLDRMTRGLWPSGASASKTATTPIMPAPGQDMTRYMEQMRDAQTQLDKQTMPAQPPQPPTPAAPPAPASAPAAPAPPAPTTTRPTTTRPRQVPHSAPQRVQQGFAALVEAQDSHLQPPVPNAEAFEQKVDEIAADIQAENPTMHPSVARRLAVAAIRLYPETVKA